MHPRALRTPLLALVATAFGSLTAAAPPFTATEMMKLKRLADPRLSPHGQWVAYAATEIDLDVGTRSTDVWLIPAAGGEPRRLTTHPRSDSSPRWSPDGKRLAFLSNRDGAPQVYLLDLAGGEPRKATSLGSGVNSFFWLDDRSLLAVSDVRPGGQPEEKDGSSARAYEQLLFRHWDSWEDGKRSHLLVVHLDGGEPRDLTPGDAASWRKVSVQWRMTKRRIRPITRVKE